VYRTELKENQRISPYIPLWLLAWGANMNIQYMTASSFLSYISKYIPKPEPSARVEDSTDLRQRDNRSKSPPRDRATSPQKRGQSLAFPVR